MNTSDFALTFGALAPQLAEQFKTQGLKLIDKANLVSLQKDADAIVRLFLNDILTDSEVRRARQRLIKQIAKQVKMKARQ